jgi:hypothetical protein
MVRRVITLVTVALVMAAMMVVFAGPASAQGGGCKAFGQSVPRVREGLCPLSGEDRGL